VIDFEHLALIFYRLLLFGYPSKFRTEFGVEMQMVFRIAIEEGQQSDKKPITLLLWRELRDWPTAVIREHLRARRHKMSTNGFVDAKQLSLNELLAAFVIFLIPLLFVIVSISVFPDWFSFILLVAIFASVISAFVFAVIKGLPRWSFSYLGFILFIGLYFWGPIWPGWGAISPFINNLFGSRGTHSEWENLLCQGVMEVEIWFMVLLAGLVLIALLRMLPLTRGIWQRVRADWTQLSLLVYGGVIL